MSFYSSVSRFCIRHKLQSLDIDSELWLQSTKANPQLTVISSRWWRLPLDDAGEILCYFRDWWAHIQMEEIEEGLKEEVIFRPSSCKWAYWTSVIWAKGIPGGLGRSQTLGRQSIREILGSLWCIGEIGGQSRRWDWKTWVPVTWATVIVSLTGWGRWDSGSTTHKWRACDLRIPWVSSASLRACS